MFESSLLLNVSHFLLHILLSFPERSEGNEVMKIGIRDDKCFGGRKDFGGAEMVQGGSAAP